MINFQNNIQQNKDWNKYLKKGYDYIALFQNNIQQNKDWNSIQLQQKQ